MLDKLWPALAHTKLARCAAKMSAIARALYLRIASPVRIMASRGGRVSTTTEKDWFATRPWIDREDADIESYLRSQDRLADVELRRQLETWRRDGIVILPRAVDADLIDAMLGDISHLLERPADYELAIEFRGTQYPNISNVSREILRDSGLKLNCLFNISAAATRLSLCPAATEFLGHVFGEDPAVLQTLTFFRGSEQPVHVDYPYVRTQTRIGQLAASWIALEDVTPEAGALAYWPGSHNVDLIGFFDWGQGNIVLEPDSTRHATELSTFLRGRLDALGLKKQLFLPRKGDLLIWHGALAHEGSAISNPASTRKSHVTHYTSLSAYPREFMFPDAFEKRRFTRVGRGYAFEVPWLKGDQRLPSSSAARRPTGAGL